ncbi:unnamed protein product [Mytilus edulis]|uniref:Uncharacterized protein n=1 Tax=Mytilus edulis TaxID=6550 RepID=A0A8S3ULL4_MYTED|nr:unnamed protein product [Mytilus edulis]
MEVKDKYKEVVTSQNVFLQPQDVRGAVSDSVSDASTKHCFDMDMGEIRNLIGAVLCPTNKMQGTGRMKNFFDNPENCPQWWKDTSVPFASLNHPKSKLYLQFLISMKAKRRLIALEKHDLSAFKKVKITEASKPVYLSSDEECQEGFTTHQPSWQSSKFKEYKAKLNGTYLDRCFTKAEDLYRAE